MLPASAVSVGLPSTRKATKKITKAYHFSDNKTGSERLGKLPKVKQLIKGRART